MEGEFPGLNRAIESELPNEARWESDIGRSRSNRVIKIIYMQC
jgi:hypothetical protein